MRLTLNATKADRPALMEYLPLLVRVFARLPLPLRLSAPGAVRTAMRPLHGLLEAVGQLNLSLKRPFRIRRVFERRRAECRFLLTLPGIVNGLHSVASSQPVAGPPDVAQARQLPLRKADA
jgi:hypothetical protein